MSKINEINNMDKQQLMERIIEVRYTDIEQEKNLCIKLLDISERVQDFYGCAFAHVYLIDSCLALGNYESCDFYILWGRVLCKEYGYDDLMLMLCHFAGIYYQKLNDDRTALDYFLEGKGLAEVLGDVDIECKIYNNIGYAFGHNDDWESARTYFQLAFDKIEPYLEGENITSAITYLSNMAESCQHIGDTKGALGALERCEKLGEDSVYSRIRVGCSWCFYYASIKDVKRCGEIADRLIETDMQMVEDQFFVSNTADALCGTLLEVGDKKRAGRLLDMMDKMEYGSSLLLQYKFQCLKIKYAEDYGTEEEQQKAYEDFYGIAVEVSKIEDENRAQSMISKIQIHKATTEREDMLLQMQELRDVSQMDELTGLYNRRYFRKMVTKTIQQENITSVGFIMMDVDYFKQYNDYYGHFKGDEALRLVAKALKENEREGVYSGRYGGDEFICLCINITKQELIAYILQVKDTLRREKIPHEKHKSSDVLTISSGYCWGRYSPDREAAEILKLADQALYDVKNKERGGYMGIDIS